MSTYVIHQNHRSEIGHVNPGECREKHAGFLTTSNKGTMVHQVFYYPMPLINAMHREYVYAGFWWAYMTLLRTGSHAPVCFILLPYSVGSISTAISWLYVSTSAEVSSTGCRG